MVSNTATEANAGAPFLMQPPRDAVCHGSLGATMAKSDEPNVNSNVIPRVEELPSAILFAMGSLRISCNENGSK